MKLLRGGGESDDGYRVVGADSTSIRLTLVDFPRPHEEGGVTKIHTRDMEIVDETTGRPLKGHSGWIWGPGSLLVEPCQDPLFTPEHCDPDKDYLVVVYECAASHRLSEDPWDR